MMMKKKEKMTMVVMKMSKDDDVKEGKSEKMKVKVKSQTNIDSWVIRKEKLMVRKGKGEEESKNVGDHPDLQ